MSTTPEFYASRKTESTWVIVGLIILLTGLAYSNSFNGPFVFDDSTSIQKNPTIRELGNWKKLVSPPLDGATVTGRPLLNISLALNYAGSGTSVRGYHVTNLVIHILASLLLFGILWRTFLSAVLQDRFGEMAIPLAGVTTLLWSLHPVQTESVTYIIQRAESLAGMFYLLIFYGFIRGASEGSRVWSAVAVAAAFLGVATKETVVTAPLLLLAYDRIFLSESWREVWKDRGSVHLGIGCCWIFQGCLIAITGLSRGGTMGVPADGSVGSFVLSQFMAVVHYLRLAFWPQPLVFDYGFPVAVTWSVSWPDVVIILGLGVAIIWSLKTRPAVGFAGIWFFTILAPTSLVPGRLQGIAEHRLYLSLAAVAAVTALAGYRWFGRRALAGLALLAIGLGLLTFQRNRDYQSRQYLWTDTVNKQPQNARAQDNLGRALVQEGKLPEAIPYFAAAVRLKPDYAPAHRNLGRALAEQGSVAEATVQLGLAVQLEPDNGDYHHYLGEVLLKAGRTEEAAKQYALALRTAPDLAESQETQFGDALLARGKSAEAVTFFTRALALRPQAIGAMNNLGRALVAAGRPREAVEIHFKAMEIKPGDAETTFYLGNAFLEAGALDEAEKVFRRAIKLDPRSAEAHCNLGATLVRMGHLPEAEIEFEFALKIDPHSKVASDNLARLRRR